jgi:hypothetical protein
MDKEVFYKLNFEDILTGHCSDHFKPFWATLRLAVASGSLPLPSLP